MKYILCNAENLAASRAAWRYEMRTMERRFSFTNGITAPTTWKGSSHAWNAVS
jgi:hypothetical protein